MDTDDGRDSTSPSMSRQNDSIASHHETCQALFMKCHKAIQPGKNNLAGEEQSVPLESQMDRYCIWYKNIAAHQDAKLPSSLEYRLREDENAITIVKKALIYLAESLEMLLMILTGEKENETWDSTSELAELSLSIEEGITSLFELSMIIRKKPEKDEYIKAALATSYDPTPDIVHVGDKYPLTRSRDTWLMERLGTAITRRRQYLRYRKDHQEKMEQIHELRKDADGKTVWSGEKASTYVHGDILGKGIPNPSMPSNLSSVALGKRPLTEYADSSRGKDGALDLLRTPLLPKNAKGVRVKYGEHFECPYCLRPQNVRDKNEWKKHVFSDLRPYVCTFESCGLNMFDSQNQWFSHELRFHRELWFCKFCNESPRMSRPDLETHLGNLHTDFLPGTDMETVIDTCAINRVDATCCPLCTTYGSRLQSINQSTKCDVSLKQFQEHLGRHMEQLALAALPVEDSEERDTNEDDSTSDELSIDAASIESTGHFWTTQATLEGKVFYYNTKTGESRTDVPPGASAELFMSPINYQSVTSDRAPAVPIAEIEAIHQNRVITSFLQPGPAIPNSHHNSEAKSGASRAKFTIPPIKELDRTSLGLEETMTTEPTSLSPIEKPKRASLLRPFFGVASRTKESGNKKTADFPEIPEEKYRRELPPGFNSESPRRGGSKRAAIFHTSLDTADASPSSETYDTATDTVQEDSIHDKGYDNSEIVLNSTEERGRPVRVRKRNIEVDPQLSSLDLPLASISSSDSQSSNDEPNIRRQPTRLHDIEEDDPTQKTSHIP